ncbi:hypothetical protein GOP47_0019690 [Adiantum capillus-veneris]|uniref:B box-type domain-containing protein n=1 Tax=Adiantum capillus-veneris TaxID=13818 RepID=A0A9D4UBY9_ADICA|nr:hypothetical protein GOP47_0019690 [Adiantum capillus-veneris]
MGKEEQWVEALLGETYFGACTTHASVRKNERNVFCAHCHVAICQHCLPYHLNHSLLQIRRYVYHDVIRLHDIEKLVDCDHVQSYIVNSAKVVFLNQRPQSRPAKGVGNACETCDRILQDGWRFCSLACKVDASLNKGHNGGCGKGLKAIVSAPWSAYEKDSDEQLSPNCVFPEPTLSSLSPSSSVSTADDTSRAHPTLPQSTELSKLVGSTSPSTSNSIKSLNSVNSPGTLKWARTLKWPPNTAKLAKRLPFTQYGKLSITAKLPSGNILHASKPFDSFEQCLDYRYPSSADMPLEVAACGQYEGNFSLAKRRKGTPHRSPSF